MKRSLNILMALMLSLMVVYLSVGTIVMHCLHYDKVIDYLIFPYLQIGCKSFFCTFAAKIVVCLSLSVKS